MIILFLLGYVGIKEKFNFPQGFTDDFGSLLLGVWFWFYYDLEFGAGLLSCNLRDVFSVICLTLGFLFFGPLFDQLFRKFVYCRVKFLLSLLILLTLHLKLLNPAKQQLVLSPTSDQFLPPLPLSIDQLMLLLPQPIIGLLQLLTEPQILRTLPHQLLIREMLIWVPIFLQRTVDLLLDEEHRFVQPFDYLCAVGRWTGLFFVPGRQQKLEVCALLLGVAFDDRLDFGPMLL